MRMALTTVASENGAAEHNARHRMASTSRANSSKELSGHRASSKKQFHAGGATLPAPSRVTEISPGAGMQFISRFCPGCVGRRGGGVGRKRKRRNKRGEKKRCIRR
jgi:hypothetical protein